MKTRIYILLGISALSILYISCDKSFEGECWKACCQQVIISAADYQNAPSDELTIDTVQISGDCLSVRFTSGGCDGNSWTIKLIDSEVIMKSYPPRRNLRLSLKNDEECDMVITKEIAFDVSKLKLESDSIYLILTNSGDQVLYKN